MERSEIERLNSILDKQEEENESRRGERMKNPSRQLKRLSTPQKIKNGHWKRGIRK